MENVLVQLNSHNDKLSLSILHDESRHYTCIQGNKFFAFVCIYIFRSHLKFILKTVNDRQIFYYVDNWKVLDRLFNIFSTQLKYSFVFCVNKLLSFV